VAAVGVPGAVRAGRSSLGTGETSATCKLSLYKGGTARCVVSYIKSCQLPRNSAETACTTNPEPSISCR